MASHQDHHSMQFAPPAGALNEHLDYFTTELASKNPILDTDFDSLFSADFDLVFDPLLASNNANNEHHVPAAPTSTAQQPVAQHSVVYQQHHQQQYYQQPAPQTTPVNVYSNNGIKGFYSRSPQTSAPSTTEASVPAPVPMSVPSCTQAATVSPAVPPKPVMTFDNSKASSAAAAVVSPDSVTTVFTEIPKPVVAKSSPRKRSYSSVSATTVISKPAPKAAPIDTSNMSFQEQEDLRRERNRHHAKRSRQRKRDYMNQLEEAVMDMRKENERLFEILGMNSSQAKADLAKAEERKAEIATEKFIAGLKQPRNRVLDNTTLAFLRELWK